MSIVGVNYGVSHKLSEMVKNLVNLFKGCGCGQSPQILSVYETNDSQTARCLAA